MQLVREVLERVLSAPVAHGGGLIIGGRKDESGAVSV